MTEYSISNVLFKGPFWQLFKGMIKKDQGVVMRWQNNKEALNYLNFPLMKMISVKSPYLSNIVDLNYRENYIDVLITNNIGIPVQVIPKCQIFKGYSHYYTNKEQFKKDFLLENIFFAKQSAISISILDFGVQKRRFLQMKEQNLSEQSLFQYYQPEWNPRILKKNNNISTDNWTYSLGIILFCIVCSKDCLNSLKQLIAIQLNKSEKVMIKTICEFIIEVCRKHKIKPVIVMLIQQLIQENIQWDQILQHEAFQDDENIPQLQFSSVKSEFQTIGSRKISIKNEFQMRQSTSQPTLRLSQVINHRHNHSNEQLQKPKHIIKKKIVSLASYRQMYDTQSESEKNEQFIEPFQKKISNRHQKLQNFIADEILIDQQSKKEDFQSCISTTEAEHKYKFRSYIPNKKMEIDNMQDKIIIKQDEHQKINEKLIQNQLYHRSETQNQIENANANANENEKLIVQNQPRKVGIVRQETKEIEHYNNDTSYSEKIEEITKIPNEPSSEPKKTILEQEQSGIEPQENESSFKERVTITSTVQEVIEFHISIRQTDEEAKKKENFQQFQEDELIVETKDQMPMFTLIKSDQNIKSITKNEKEAKQFTFESPKQSSNERSSRKRVSFMVSNLSSLEISPIRNNSPNQENSFSSPLRPLKGILSKNIISTDVQLNHDLILKKYHECIDAYGILGSTVVQLLEIFKGFQNFWILPLFLFFKRMDLLTKKQNIFGYQYFEYLVESRDYAELIARTKSENDSIMEEYKKLLRIALNKAKSLNENQKKKVTWFINNNFEQDIKQTCQIYLWSQIMPHLLSIIQQKSVQSNILLLKKTQFMIQTSIILLEQKQILIFDENQYDYDTTQDILKSDDMQEIVVQISKNESILDQYRQSDPNQNQKS